LIAISDRYAKLKTNSAITDRQINPTALEYALNWTHIQRIMRVSNPEAKSCYLRETVEQSWDVRTLDRNISTQYYERLLMSQVKKPVIQEMLSKNGKYRKKDLNLSKIHQFLNFLDYPAILDIARKYWKKQ
jgi:predicted nuclease of restriction endonuclease-like (RecB) superfamily